MAVVDPGTTSFDTLALGKIFSNHAYSAPTGINTVAHGLTKADGTGLVPQFFLVVANDGAPISAISADATNIVFANGSATLSVVTIIAF